MESHPLVSAAIGEEEERALFAARTENLGAECHHEPREPRQHLMDLRKEHRHAIGQRRHELPRIARAVVATLGDDLKRQPRPRYSRPLGEVRRHREPRAVARQQDQRLPPEVSPAKAPPGGRAREPRRQRRRAANHLHAHRHGEGKRSRRFSIDDTIPATPSGMNRSESTRIAPNTGWAKSRDTVAATSGQNCRKSPPASAPQTEVMPPNTEPTSKRIESQ